MSGRDEGNRPSGQPTGDGFFQSLMQSGVASALGTLFNFLVLNLALLVASIAIVTAPLSINAAFVALDRWRRKGEDRVIAEFVAALRSPLPRRVTLANGVPIAVILLGLEEVHYFATGGASWLASASVWESALWCSP